MLVEVENLTKRFGYLTAVYEVSFAIERGEIVGMLGLNGAGKTTTIQMLLGLIAPTAGEMGLRQVDADPPRGSFGPHEFHLALRRVPFRMTVGENLDVFARLYNGERARE
jgi:ABC-2 type transport system ATP-binding protein